MKLNYYTIIFVFCISNSLFAQWLDFNDQSGSRIVVSNISDNSAPEAVDDQEKDLAVGDFDKDTFTDLVVVRKSPFSNPGPKTDLLFMNVNGVLTDQTNTYAPEFLSDSTDSRDVICVDVNNDTWLDIFIVTTFGDQPKLFINQGEDINGDWLGFLDESSTRLPTITVNPLQFCAGWSGDLTGNNFPDIYMVNYSPTGNALDVLLINDGTGNFSDESQTRLGNLRNSSFGTSVEIHDIDNDNDLDIVKNLGLFDIAPFNTKGMIALFNNGAGTFTNWHKLPGDASYMHTGGDLNNDGMVDFYVVDDGRDYVDYITAFTVDTDLTVTQTLLTTDRTDAFGGNVKMIDFDGDGDLDVGLSSVDTDIPPCETPQSRRYIIFENQGLHSGILNHPYGATMNAWNISSYDHDYIDIDKDGKLDMILGACDSYMVFMQEETLSLGDQIATNTRIYPNPSNGMIQVLTDASVGADAEVEVYTINGILMKSIPNRMLLKTNNGFKFDLRHQISQGMYFVNLITREGTITKKVVIH